RLDWTLARCCELYNAALQERKDAWDACTKHPNCYDALWGEEQARAYSVNFKESRKLVETYGVLVFEKLSTKNLVKRPKPRLDEETGQFLPNGASQKAGLNKSISDAGWGMFVEYCKHKAEEAGAKVLLVHPQRYQSDLLRMSQERQAQRPFGAHAHLYTLRCCLG